MSTAAAGPRVRVRLAVAALSDPGLRRARNQDRVASDRGRGIAVLADGMGGHQGGETASALAVETVLRELGDGLEALAGATVPDPEGFAPESVLARRALERSNAVVHDTARDRPECEGMGTTLTLALFYGDRLTLAHVGDSRAYRLRGGRLEQLTRDHTLTQELVDQGFYTADEAPGSPNRNIVTRALGVEAGVHVDLQEDVTLPGDLYLLCSDGLNDMLDDEAITLTLRDIDDSLDAGARRLVDQANERGGLDNVSVVLVRVLEPAAEPRGWFERFVDWFQ